MPMPMSAFGVDTAAGEDDRVTWNKRFSLAGLRCIIFVSMMEAQAAAHLAHRATLVLDHGSDLLRRFAGTWVSIPSALTPPRRVFINLWTSMRGGGRGAAIDVRYWGIELFDLHVGTPMSGNMRGADCVCARVRPVQ